MGVQQLFGQQQNLGLRGQSQLLQQAFRALRRKDAGNAQTRAQRLFQQIGSLDPGQAARLAAGVGQGAAQLFQAGILLTLYNADRHGCEWSLL